MQTARAEWKLVCATGNLLKLSASHGPQKRLKNPPGNRFSILVPAQLKILAETESPKKSDEAVLCGTQNLPTGSAVPDKLLGQQFGLLSLPGDQGNGLFVEAYESFSAQPVPFIGD